MSDGRAFTNWTTNCTLMKTIQAKYGIQNSHDLRVFLQQNADKVKADFSSCEVMEDCKFCPVCKEAIDYRPKGEV
jgi:hypothetical protein